MPEISSETTTTNSNCNNCNLNLESCECLFCRGCRQNRLEEEMCTNCERCTYNGCCECWTCSTCVSILTASTLQCANCGKCEECCNCWTCESCDSTVSCRSCVRCGDCDGCCECESDILDFFSQSEPVWHAATKSQFKINPSKRYISAEIEVSRVDRTNLNSAKVIGNWKGAIVNDGSIQGDYPHEINTAPANGDLFVKQIEEICSELAKDKAKVNKSCGLHVHIDARDFNFYDVRKLVFLYEKIEDALFSLVAPSRKRSTFCTPCGVKFVKDLEKNIVPKENEKTLIKNVYGCEENIPQLKRNKYHSARYSAMNIHSWIYRGTIECRMHQGTVNADKIISWGLLWASVLDFAFLHSEKEIKTLKGDSLSILLSICPTDKVRDWVVSRYKHFKENSTIDENAGDI